MRAGLLRDKADFYEFSGVQSASGATKKDWVKTFSARCSRIKAQTTGTGVDAKEVFDGSIVTADFRKSVKIKYGQRVKIGLTTYEIQLIDEHLADNCTELTLKRVNT